MYSRNLEGREMHCNQTQCKKCQQYRGINIEFSCGQMLMLSTSGAAKAQKVITL